MTDLQACMARADGPKKQRLSEQWHDAINYHTIICDCGLARAIEMAFRCLYCGEWYCANCAEVHFGKTIQEHIIEKRVARRQELAATDGNPK